MSGLPPFNVVVLAGPVRAAPERRPLADGSVAVQFDVATASGAVPCSWIDPPARSVEALAAGTPVVVVGAVRRRFFRAGGATHGRTEVVVDRAVPQRQARRAARALDEVVGVLSAGRARPDR